MAKDVLNSNSILLLVPHRQEILCFVEDDLTTRPDMSGLSWGMLWDIRWDLTVFRNIRVDVANLQKESDMISSGECINMVLVNLLLVTRQTQIDWRWRSG